MDLGAFIRVMWRFKLLLAVGVVVASFLALFSVARIELNGATPSVVYRANEEWISASTLFVTQEGFPWGRAILDEMIRVENEGADPTYVPRYGEPGRYSGLAALYAELAKSDAVRREVLTSAARGARYEPQVVQSPDSGSALPMIYMTGYGPTPATAEFVANRATEAFQRYLSSEQIRNEIPPDKRVEVVVTQKAIPAAIHESRSLARPVFLFVLVVMVFVALSFALENLRPRVRPTPALLRAEPARARRSA